ncbi:uncharacterized protein LOC110856415 [Folsomia candida]|uniref:uncharacterized protein LOC110856415 n=1 Tax=Folsomia candida TaxID=158441 RepID=UPI000B90978C|nr:uncharacterized protein LOC110856415 [Folsomia candida]
MFKIVAYVVLLVALSSALPMEDEYQNGEFIQEKLTKWKCHKGFSGVMTEDMKKAIETCKAKKIKAKYCFKACFAEEMKFCRNETLDEPKLKSHLKEMFDQNEPLSASTEAKWIEDTKKCIADFKKSGKKFPKEFTGECKELEDFSKCMMDSRVIILFYSDFSYFTDFCNLIFSPTFQECRLKD